MNPYVDYGAVTTGPPPFHCADARMWAFFIEADHDKLVAMCDRVLNTPSGGEVHYAPLTRHVMMTLGTMNVTSMPKPYDTMGMVVELHAAFWVYTVAVKKEGPVLVAQHLASSSPRSSSTMRSRSPADERSSDSTRRGAGPNCPTRTCSTGSISTCSAATSPSEPTLAVIRC